MPPLPNTLYTRDTTCWIYGGVTFNPLYWPARHDETLLMKAIYQFHPDFVGVERLVGRSRARLGPGHARGRRRDADRQRRRAHRHERAHLAAGHHPGRGGAVRAGAAEQVIVAGMPKLRAAMHLDTVFTFADRDCATVYPGIVDGIHPFTLRPGDSAAGRRGDRGDATVRRGRRRRARTDELRVIHTGGDVYATERQQWDSGNNLVAIEPGSSSPTTATPTPTRCCARPASRSSPSSAPSSAAGAAAATA